MDIEKVSQGFAAAGAKPRLSVLMKLVRTGHEGMTVGELQRSLNVPPSTLAHHLRYLLDADLIEQKRLGRKVINVANFRQLRALAEFFLNECCADSDIDPSCC